MKVRLTENKKRMKTVRHLMMSKMLKRQLKI